MTQATCVQNRREAACPEPAVQPDRRRHVRDPRDARLGILVTLVTAAVFYGAIGWHIRQLIHVFGS